MLHYVKRQVADIYVIIVALPLLLSNTKARCDTISERPRSIARSRWVPQLLSFEASCRWPGSETGSGRSNAKKGTLTNDYHRKPSMHSPNTPAMTPKAPSYE